MYYLVDTNVSLHAINDNIFSVAKLCKKNRTDITITDTIAIAKCSEDEYIIVSNDKGRGFLHPEQNLFDGYAVDEGVAVISSEKWLDMIKYKISDS